ncbi:MAG: YjjG family noncanonical pyrimidine nucleotidase [Ruminococcus sp.]|nr:YjjG family noncanonical pyrimidine nucleotidase [Ruminococcus sp.]
MIHRNLLFDLDQTLLDFHASERIALKSVMQQNDVDFTQQLCDSFKQINKSLWLEFEKGKISKPELFVTRFRRLFEECDCNTEKMDLVKINNSFIDCMSQNGVMMEGSKDLLKKITKNIPDAKIYIITNGVTRNAMGRINSTGLNDYISRVFISDTIGASKPSQDYFEYVKNAVGEPDESYLVIGDSLSSDMLGAKNANLASCWFMPDGDIRQAIKEYNINYTANSFDELYDMINKWSASALNDRHKPL